MRDCTQKAIAFCILGNKKKAARLLCAWDFHFYRVFVHFLAT
jgi:hypothetical protein